jgi:serine/threonine protein kinase
MEGGELYKRIIQRDRNPYTERDAARFISMIVQAVAHLHGMNMVRFSNAYFYFSFISLLFRLIVSNFPLSLSIVSFRS